MLGNTSIIGYAGRDSELRYTAKEKAYCQFSVGMTEYYNTASGERRKKLTWYSCKLWLFRTFGATPKIGDNQCV